MQPAASNSSWVFLLLNLIYEAGWLNLRRSLCIFDFYLFHLLPGRSTAVGGASEVARLLCSVKYKRDLSEYKFSCVLSCATVSSARHLSFSSNCLFRSPRAGTGSYSKITDRYVSSKSNRSMTCSFQLLESSSSFLLM